MIRHLADYYDIIAADPNSGLPPLGYGISHARYAINLSEDGKLINIIPELVQVKRGKRQYYVPKDFLLPERIKRARAPVANFLSDNSKYVFGLGPDSVNDLNKYKSNFILFRDLHNKILKDVNTKLAKALLKFLNNYKCGDVDLTEMIEDSEQDIFSANYVFIVNGEYVHDDEEIKSKWDKYYLERLGEVIDTCIVTGEKSPIARLHPSIRGVRDAQSSGASLVSFNEPAFEYDNKSQGYNSPISSVTAFKYGTILNRMLDSNEQKILIGDTTTVFWAESNNNVYSRLSQFALSNPQQIDEIIRDEATEDDVRTFLMNCLDGKISDVGSIETNTKFYILGLAPNASRLSIRFFYKGTFGQFFENMMQHYSDLDIQKEWPSNYDNIPIWSILKDLVVEGSKANTHSPLLAGSLTSAILHGKMYPRILYNSILSRIKADKKINYTRTAFIKAYLLRYARINNIGREELTVSLNPTSTNTAYLLGRLFAVLEKAQKDALGDLNATIRDKYFSSASATPSAVFSSLLRGAQNHISKTNNRYIDMLIQDILNQLEVEYFPSNLTLDEQGIFIIGYYHQRANLYQKREKNMEGEK